MRARSLWWLPLVAVASLAAGGEATVADVVPADAWLTVTYDGGNPAFRETPLGRFLQEPEVKEALAQVQPLIDNLFAGLSIEAGTDVVPAIRSAVGCQVALAVLGPSEGNREPSVLVVANLGAPQAPARKAMEELLIAVRAKAGAENVKQAAITDQVTGLSVHGEILAFHGPFFLWSKDVAALRRAVDPAVPKLAARLGAESPVLRVRYDHAQLLKAAAAEIDPEAQNALNATGINAIRSAELSFTPRGKRLVTGLSIDMPDAAKRMGLAKWLTDGKAFDPALLKRVPRDATLFWLGSPDLPGLWDTIWKMVAEIDDNAAGEMRKALGELEEKAGLKVRDGLLAPLGSGTLFIGQRSGFSVRVVVVQRVKDGQAIEKSLGQLVNRLDLLLMGAGRLGSVRTGLKPFDYRGHACRYLWLMGLPALMLPSWTPCWTQVDDLLILAQHPLDLKQYIDFIEDKGPSVLENAEFRALQAVVPEGAASISYGAWPDVIVGLYNTLAPIAMIAQGLQEPLGLPGPLDLANMPSSRLIRRYASGTVVYTAFDGARYRIEAQGDGLDFLSPHGVSAVAAGFGFAVPALFWVRAAPPAVIGPVELDPVELPVPAPEPMPRPPDF